MIQLTDNARQRYDDYLRRMRSAFGTRSVDADEIEQSVREHVEVALAGVPAPIAEEELGRVLERLGPPERWLGEESRPAWRRALDSIQRGPEDWRLAYLSFGLFFLMVLFFPVGGILLLLPAYLVSRATVELVREKGQTLGARRWLVYPPIAFLLFFAVVAFIVGPAAPAAVFGIEEGAFDRLFRVPANGFPRFAFNAGGAAIIFGSWWIIAAGLAAVFLRPIRFVFVPLLDRLQRKHMGVLAVIGAVVAAIGGGIVYSVI